MSEIRSGQIGEARPTLCMGKASPKPPISDSRGLGAAISAKAGTIKLA